jgi:hypothetical protein
MYGRRSEPGFPHKGWEHAGISDAREGLRPDAIPDDYPWCEACGQQRTRWIHTISHPAYGQTLNVGCVCAGKLTEDYATAEQAESRAKNKAERAKRARKAEHERASSTWQAERALWIDASTWGLSRSGNPHRNAAGGLHIVLIQDKTGNWRYSVNKVWCQRRFGSDAAARLSAFAELNPEPDALS